MKYIEKQAQIYFSAPADRTQTKRRKNPYFSRVFCGRVFGGEFLIGENGMTLSFRILERRGAKLIAENDTHTIWRMPVRDTKWVSYYVRLIDLPKTRKGRRAKRAWRLGYNGERLADNRCSEKLATDEQLRVWVVPILEDDWPQAQLEAGYRKAAA